MKSTIKAGKITKIFITHLHGDHIFGLPGLLCTISQNIVENKQPIEIYGPIGLRRYIRICLELSRSMVTYNYIVHELIPLDDKQIPEDILKWSIIQSDDSILHPSELLGKQIKSNENGVWDLIDNDKLSIKSSWISHRVATFGYVIELKPTVGSLNVEALRLKGVSPGPIYAQIKSGKAVQLPNGEILNPADFIGESKQGKKITILGDCYDVSDDMIKLSMHSDVAIHESTLENSMKEKAISNGHSTPSMAALFANKINAKCLILNHFSQRYKPLNSSFNKDDNDCDTIQKLIDEARSTLNLNINLFAAYDLFTFKV